MLPFAADVLSDRLLGLIYFVIVFVVLGCFGTALLYATKAAIYQSRRLKIGIPLTRANTADLPAPDTLVRASKEPVQEQEAVLLRAVTETQERHEEQLVRASAGGTE